MLYIIVAFIVLALYGIYLAVSAVHDPTKKHLVEIRRDKGGK